MRIAITKQPSHLKEASYAHFAAGTVGDVWVEEEELDVAAQPAKPQTNLTFDA